MSDTNSKPRNELRVRIGGIIVSAVGGITLIVTLFFMPNSFLNSCSVVGVAALFLVTGGLVGFSDPNTTKPEDEYRGEGD